MEAHTVKDLFLTNVRVPTANGVGQIRQVWNHLVRGLSVERLIIAHVDGYGATLSPLRATVGTVGPPDRQLPDRLSPGR